MHTEVQERINVLHMELQVGIGKISMKLDLCTTLMKFYPFLCYVYSISQDLCTCMYFGTLICICLCPQHIYLQALLTSTITCRVIRLFSLRNLIHVPFYYCRVNRYLELSDVELTDFFVIDFLLACSIAKQNPSTYPICRDIRCRVKRFLLYVHY